MSTFPVFATIFVVFVATGLSVPLIRDESDMVDQSQQAVIITSPDGKPEFVVTGAHGEELGRAGLNKVTQLLNFTSYLDGRPPNSTALTFVPLITILAGLSNNQQQQG